MKALQNFQKAQHLFIVDALRYSLILEKKAFESLVSTIKEIESKDDGVTPPDEGLVLVSIRDAWQIIDFVYRIRGLVSQVPGLSQKSIEIQLFERNTRRVESFRNLYQHLNSEIPRISGNTNPIMGVLSWVLNNPTQSISVNVGTGVEGAQVASIAIDTWTWKFANNLLFSAGNQDIDLELVHSTCVKLDEFLNVWLAEKNHLHPDNLQVSTFRFSFAPPPNLPLNSGPA